jgi:hypothetical protein
MPQHAAIEPQYKQSCWRLNAQRLLRDDLARHVPRLGQWPLLGTPYPI